MAGPTIVQATAKQSVGGDTGQLTFGSNLTAGNLLVAICMGRTGGDLNQATFPTSGLGSGWNYASVDANGTSSTNNSAVAVYTRTVIVGDNKTPPEVCANFDSFAAATMCWEINGGNASFDASAADNNLSAAGATTATVTSVSTNVMALIAVGAVFEKPTVTAGGWSASDGNDGNSQGIEGYHQAVAASSTGVNATVSATGFGPSAYAIVMVKGSSSTESGPIAMTVPSVTFSGSGARTEDGPIAMTVPSVTFSETGSVIHEKGPISMTVPRPTFLLGGNSSTPGAGTVTFSTFGG